MNTRWQGSYILSDWQRVVSVINKHYVHRICYRNWCRQGVYVLGRWSMNDVAGLSFIFCLSFSRLWSGLVYSKIHKPLVLTFCRFFIARRLCCTYYSAAVKWKPQFHSRIVANITKCKQDSAAQSNGLSDRWRGVVWCNKGDLNFVTPTLQWEWIADIVED